MSLTTDLRKIAKKRKQSLEQVYRATMNDVSNFIITSSPVDSGAFRANWLSALNSGDYTYDKAKTNISDAEGRLTATVGGLSVNDNFYFTNSMPYAKRLEDGYSDFAPNGMVKVAILDFPQIVAQRAREEGGR